MRCSMTDRNECKCGLPMLSSNWCTGGHYGRGAFISTAIDRHTAQDRVTLFTWDWKEQPDLDAISEALRHRWNGTTCPKIVTVEDSGGDLYVAIVTGEPMTKAEAQALWDDWDYEYEEEMGRA